MKAQHETHMYGCDGVSTKDGDVVMLEYQAFQKAHVMANIDAKIKFADSDPLIH